MSWHDLVSSQASNVCITRHAPLNAIAYIVCVKQFVMSLPAISLGDWFSVNGKGGTGVSACTLQMIHTTYIRTNVPTYLRLQHTVSAPRCRDKNICKALSRDGMSKVTYNSHTYNRLVQYKFSNGTPILPPSVTVPTALVPTPTPHQCLQSFLMSQNHHMHNVLLDGNCTFWALSRQLYGSDKHHIQVRSMLHKGWSLPYAP